MRSGRDPDIGAHPGHARALNADHNVLTRMQDVWYDGQFPVWKAAESVFGAVTCVSGPLAAFRREAIYPYLPAWAEDRSWGRSSASPPTASSPATSWARCGSGSASRPITPTTRSSATAPTRPGAGRSATCSSARGLDHGASARSEVFRQQARWKKSFIRNLCFTGPFYWRAAGPRGALLLALPGVLPTPIMAVRHLICCRSTARWFLVGLYLAGCA